MIGICQANVFELSKEAQLVRLRVYLRYMVETMRHGLHKSLHICDFLFVQRKAGLQASSVWWPLTLRRVHDFVPDSRKFIVVKCLARRQEVQNIDWNSDWKEARFLAVVQLVLQMEADRRKLELLDTLNRALLLRQYIRIGEWSDGQVAVQFDGLVVLQRWSVWHADRQWS